MEEFYELVVKSALDHAFEKDVYLFKAYSFETQKNKT